MHTSKKYYNKSESNNNIQEGELDWLFWTENTRMGIAIENLADQKHRTGLITSEMQQLYHLSFAINEPKRKKNAKFWHLSATQLRKVIFSFFLNQKSSIILIYPSNH